VAKTESVTVRVKSSTKARLETLARGIRRSKSYVMEEALEQYLDINEWQIAGIADALRRADDPDAVFVEHSDVARRWGIKSED